MWLALKIDHLRPDVGDIIVFRPAASGGMSWGVKVEATALVRRDAPVRPCVFDPREIAAYGGSLIIERTEGVNPVRFLVHWAGYRTAQGPGDCGAVADVTLDQHDVQRLANAAGGFGLHSN
jgi:hypothetical protein